MQITRQTELTLYYKIQDVLSVSKTGDIAKSADFLTYKLKYNNIQPQYPLNVAINGTPYNGSPTVDYINGTIKFPQANLSSDSITASYQYCPVTMYDDGRDPTDNDFKYPAVAVYEDRRRDVGYELGTRLKEIRSLWVIEVWADKGGERNDYTDTIVDLFQQGFPIIDYDIAFPLNDDFSLNTSFNAYAQQSAYAVADSINYHKGGSLDIGTVPKYLSQIFVELIVNR